MGSLTILVIIALVATVAVLFTGLASMVKGGEYDKQHVVAALYAGSFA